MSTYTSRLCKRGLEINLQMSCDWALTKETIDRPRDFLAPLGPGPRSTELSCDYINKQLSVNRLAKAPLSFKTRSSRSVSDIICALGQN